MTFKEAKRLSVLKWKYIVKNGGSRIGLIGNHPELANLLNYCGFCDKYLKGDSCGLCPIFITDKECDEGIYKKWVDAEQSRWQLYYAKKLLAIIKSCKEVK